MPLTCKRQALPGTPPPEPTDDRSEARGLTADAGLSRREHTLKDDLTSEDITQLRVRQLLVIWKAQATWPPLEPEVVVKVLLCHTLRA